jgi:hypothetical protein
MFPNFGKSADCGKDGIKGERREKEIVFIAAMNQEGGEVSQRF